MEGMHISDYTYNLPEERIAQHPRSTRGNSRLLVLNKGSGEVTHRRYSDLIEYLNPGDVVILNNTKVIKARLTGTLDGKKREFLLLEKHGKNVDTHHWKVLYKGKIKPGQRYSINDEDIRVDEVLDNGIAIISSDKSLLEIADTHGTVPLPPYMKRDASKEDIERYQTEFAKEAGSVAAPTASLNFTNELKQRLTEKGVIIEYLTLHVGIGTFLPIRTESIEDHVMHSEYFEIPKQTVQAIKTAKAKRKKVLAVGTTVTRTLEYTAEQIFNQEPRDLNGDADIFIYPGYTFKIVDAMLTNFHAPKTTVLMLAAAFASWEHLKPAYEIAAKEEYDFLSYGDSMLII